MQPVSQRPFAVNSNAINSTGLGHGQPASQPADPSPLRLLVYMQVFRLKMPSFGNDDPFRQNPVDVLHMVCTRLRAKFRHPTTRRFGGDRPDKINKLSNI